MKKRKVNKINGTLIVVLALVLILAGMYITYSDNKVKDLEKQVSSLEKEVNDKDTGYAGAYQAVLYVSDTEFYYFELVLNEDNTCSKATYIDGVERQYTDCIYAVSNNNLIVDAYYDMLESDTYQLSGSAFTTSYNEYTVSFNVVNEEDLMYIK